MPYSVRFALVFPKDHPAIPDAARYISKHQQWVGWAQDWFARELGYSFDAVVQTVFADYTLAELLAPYDKTPDDCGQNGSMNCFVVEMARRVLGWWSEPLPLSPYPAPPGSKQMVPPGYPPRIQRIVGTVLGFGGWAGAKWIAADDGTDYGVAVFGDWGLRLEVTSEPDACCVQWKGEAFCKSRVRGWPSFGHELLHAMGAGVASWGDTPLDDTQKLNLVERNQAFLYPVAVPPPEEPPPEPDEEPDPDKPRKEPPGHGKRRGRKFQ